jgi:hypothetical protein
VQGLDGLDARGWYLVACNHLSAVDILVLQHVFHGRIPFLKFFLKRELIWVPVIGLAWWALDFPFMRAARPRGLQKDLETTRRACEKFRQVPTSVMNFVEGTRARRPRSPASAAPYKHLLKPKVGGLSVALATMGEQFEACSTSRWSTRRRADLLGPAVRPLDAVIVRVQQREIPPAARAWTLPASGRRLVKSWARWPPSRSAAPGPWKAGRAHRRCRPRAPGRGAQRGRPPGRLLSVEAREHQRRVGAAEAEAVRHHGVQRAVVALAQHAAGRSAAGSSSRCGPRPWRSRPASSAASRSPPAPRPRPASGRTATWSS